MNDFYYTENFNEKSYLKLGEKVDYGILKLF